MGAAAPELIASLRPRPAAASDRAIALSAHSLTRDSLGCVDDAQRWRSIAKELAEALESDDESRRTRALVLYRQAAWREDMDDIPTTDPPTDPKP